MISAHIFIIRLWRKVRRVDVHKISCGNVKVQCVTPYGPISLTIVEHSSIYRLDALNELILDRKTKIPSPVIVSVADICEKPSWPFLRAGTNQRGHRNSPLVWVSQTCNVRPQHVYRGIFLVRKEYTFKHRRYKSVNFLRPYKKLGHLGIRQCRSVVFHHRLGESCCHRHVVIATYSFPH